MLKLNNSGGTMEENAGNEQPNPVADATPPPVPESNFNGDQTPPEPPMPDEQPAQPKKKFMSKKLMALIAAVLVLLGVGAFLVMQLSSSDDETYVVKNEIPLLRVSLVNGPLNLMYDEVYNDGALTINNQVYEGLVAFEDVSKIVPRLATSWSNPDEETWVFTLKEGVTFHSGKTMTAEDVKYSLENSENVNAGGLGDSIVGVEVVDESTVSVKTDGPDPLLLGKLAGLWIIDPATVENAEPAGTGPYVPDTTSEPTEDEVSLVAYENYHDGTVYTKALTFKRLANADAVEAFNNGEIDVASALSSDSENLNVPNLKTVTIADLGVSFLATNQVENAPLANLKVRQAIELALDPAPIIEAQEVLGQNADQFVAKEIPGFNPAVVRPAKNVEAAKTLLEEAGYGDGLELDLTYVTASNLGMYESVKTQLAEIGITVNDDYYDEDVEGFFGKLFSGEADLIFLAYAPDVLDASDTYSLLFGGDEGAIKTSINGEVATKLDEASKTVDETARLTILKDIATLISDNVASIPLYSRDAVTGLADNYMVERDFPNGGSGFRYSQVYLP